MKLGPLIPSGAKDGVVRTMAHGTRGMHGPHGRNGVGMRGLRESVAWSVHSVRSVDKPIGTGKISWEFGQFAAAPDAVA